METRVVTITQVDMTNFYVTGRDQYGTLLQVSWHLSDVITSIPALGEVWTVERQGNLWFLDKRGDDGSEATTLQELEPGDRRIDAKGNIYLNGASLIFNGSQFVPGAIPGALAAQPPASSLPSGSLYYATDQDVLYLDTGSAWQRLGMPAGATVMWFSASAPTGWVKYDGTSLPSSTGIYANLATHLGGTTTPNTNGRMPVGQGSHADVSTVGANDGLPEGQRRPKHKHSVVQPSFSAGSTNTTGSHAHGGSTSTNGSHNHATNYPAFSAFASGGGVGAVWTGGDAANRVSDTQGDHSHSISTDSQGSHAHTVTGTVSGGTVGPQTGNEPTDGAAWITTVFIAKL